MTDIRVRSAFRLNRLLSRPLTSLFLMTPARPNHVTVLSAASGVAAGMLFSRGTYLAGLAAAACYQLAMVLDNCDGEIARARNLKSEFGAWLDIAADFATDLALFSGLAFGLHQTQPDAPALQLGLLCAIGSAAHILLVVVEKMRGFGPAAFAAPNPDAGKRSGFLWNLYDGLREGESSWLVLGFALAGQAHALLYAGAVYVQVLWISALVVNFRWIAK